LFEQLPGDLETKTGILIENAVREANDFKCQECKHRGPIQPQPPFKKVDEKDFIMSKSAKELLGEELVCFQTKAPLRESTLGVGVSIKKSPRTGLCMYVNPTMDLMSMRAFMKMKVRKALEGERFSHWLPLYFGEKEVYTLESENYDHDEGQMVTSTRKIDTHERFMKLFEHSMSFLNTGSTKKIFDSE